MSANPYNIWDKVDGKDTIVYKNTTTIIGFELDKLTWKESDYGEDYLTLDEILEQVKKERSKILHVSIRTLEPLPISKNTPFLQVKHEMGMWGVIFEVGNHPEHDDQWIVHGVTKGYA